MVIPAGMRSGFQCDPRKPAVVVATRRIDPVTLRHVAAACDRLHERYVPWAGDDALPLDTQPSLVFFSKYVSA